MNSPIDVLLGKAPPESVGMIELAPGFYCTPWFKEKLLNHPKILAEAKKDDAEPV